MSAHKAHEIFVQYQKELKWRTTPQELKRLFDTCWSCRHYGIHTVKSTLARIFATLEEIISILQTGIRLLGYYFRSQCLQLSCVCWNLTVFLPLVTGSRDVDNLEPKQYYRSHLYFSTLDKMLVEFNSRFSDFNKSIIMAVQATSPGSPNFIQFFTLKPLLNHYELDE